MTNMTNLLIFPCMKKYLLMLSFCLVWASAVFADKDPENYKVVVYLADGTHFEGYVTTALENYLYPKQTEVGISKTFGGKERLYTSEEVKSVVFPANKKNSTAVIYEAVTAVVRSSMLSKAKPSKKPIFLRLIYDGKDIKGYVMPYTDQTSIRQVRNPSIEIKNYTYQYYYMPTEEKIARPYWSDIQGIMPNAKGFIKKFLKDFPEIVKMIDNGELTTKDFRENPAIVLPIMDKTYKKQE